MELQQISANIDLPTVGATIESRGRLTSVLKFLVVLYLVGMLVLSVEQFLDLPQNLTSGDFWNLLFLPVCWLYLIKTNRPIRFPYALGMSLILLGSLIGTFSSYNPLASIIFIAKEVYLYFWFVTLVPVFASFENRLMRRLLLVWLAVAVLHGILLIAQFVLPNFYSFTLSVIGSVGIVRVQYIGRPAGLFEDPVWAALFQMMSFLPLLLVGLRRELSLPLGVLLLLSILATASLGPFTAVIGASVVAVLLLLLMGHHLKLLVWLAVVLILAAGLFLFTLSLFPDVQASLQHLTIDRASYTTDQRLELWQGVSDILFSKESILGIGPDNYRDSLVGKTLHNDMLEFGVERGVIGLLGLMLLVIEALNSAVKILLKQIKSGDMAQPSGVIFVAMLIGVFLESITHQIFHFRAVWLGLAVLEATLFRMMISQSIETPVKHMERSGKRSQVQEKSSTLTVHRKPSP